MALGSMMRTFVMLLAAASFVAPAALAQTAGAPAVKKTVAPRVPPDSGSGMFSAYCAACHGPAGKGDGPAAKALAKPPANLSMLTANNGGKFPVQKVEQTLRFGVQNPAHGSSDMPTWGPTFQAMGDEATVRLRIANIISHLETLQGK